MIFGYYKFNKVSNDADVLVGWLGRECVMLDVLGRWVAGHIKNQVANSLIDVIEVGVITRRLLINQPSG